MVKWCMTQSKACQETRAGGFSISCCQDHGKHETCIIGCMQHQLHCGRLLWRSHEIWNTYVLDIYSIAICPENVAAPQWPLHAGS